MKIFIGCSSSDEILDEYKVVTKYLAEQLSMDNDLVFGCARKGLMKICYDEFIKNNRHITGICYDLYKDSLNDLKIDDLYIVKSLEESDKILQEKSDVILILPGSYGTLSEFINILEQKRTKIHNKQIIIFNINGFYNNLINMFDIIYKRVSKSYNFNELCKVFNTVDEIVKYVSSIN